MQRDRRVHQRSVLRVYRHSRAYFIVFVDVYREDCDTSNDRLTGFRFLTPIRRTAAYRVEKYRIEFNYSPRGRLLIILQHCSRIRTSTADVGIRCKGRRSHAVSFFFGPLLRDFWGGGRLSIGTTSLRLVFKINVHGF